MCVGDRSSLYPTLERDVRGIKAERVMQLESRIDEGEFRKQSADACDSQAFSERCL